MSQVTEMQLHSQMLFGLQRMLIINDDDDVLFRRQFKISNCELCHKCESCCKM